MTRRLGLWRIVFVAALALSTAASTDTNSKKTKDNSQAQKSYERPTDPSLYVGSDTCKTCHEAIYERWSKSRMANVVRDPKEHPDAIIPDFTKPDPLVTDKCDPAGNDRGD